MKLAPADELAQRIADPETGRSSGCSMPEAAAQKKEQADSLGTQIKRLPENQQEVLRLKFHAGLSYREIAEITGLTTSAGLSVGVATSVVIVYRFLTYWLRIPLGYASMTYMQRTGEL